MKSDRKTADHDYSEVIRRGELCEEMKTVRHYSEFSKDLYPNRHEYTLPKKKQKSA